VELRRTGPRNAREMTQVGARRGRQRKGAIRVRIGVVVRTRRVILAVAASAVLISISGCDPVNDAQGPVVIGLDDALLTVVVCADLDSSGLLAQTRDESSGGDWSTFWRASGSHQFASGEFIGTGQLRSAFTDAQVDIEPNVTPGTDVSIAILAEAGPNVGGSFTLDTKFFDGGT
jgi:hypothetical protein